MALSIKDEGTDRIVRRYAELHHISYTGAIKMAVGDALRREGHDVEETDRERIAREFRAVVREVQEAVKKLPVLDSRSPDEMLYDEDGLPK